MIIERRSAPIMTLSLAISKSLIETRSLFLRAASRAASLTRFSRSAPAKPGVWRARRSMFTSSPIGTRRVWTFRMPSRPFTSGRGTTTRRSNRPGRRSAGSRTSGRLVAAIRMTPSLVSKPSISTSSWLRVCSRSSCPPPRPAPRWRPTASISSMKMMQGAFFFPCTKRSRTREAPTPTNISTKSEPEIEKKGTPASPAMARARSVFPVPGAPTSSTPFGMRPPSLVNFFGSFRKAMISSSSSLASSMPATSLKVTLCVFSESSLARLFPKDIALPPPTCIWRMKKTHTPTRRSMGPVHHRDQVPGLVVLRLDVDHDALVVQRLHQIRVFGRVGLEALAGPAPLGLVVAVDGLALHADVVDPILVHRFQEVAERHLRLARLLLGHHGPEEQPEEQEEQPEAEIAGDWIQVGTGATTRDENNTASPERQSNASGGPSSARALTRAARFRCPRTPRLGRHSLPRLRPLATVGGLFPHALARVPTTPARIRRARRTPRLGRQSLPRLRPLATVG